MKARIYKINAESLALASQKLSSGLVVGIPTETVYGLAGNAFDPGALSLIFSVKNRPTFDPLIVHIKKSWNTLDELARHTIIDLAQITPSAQTTYTELIRLFWPGPLTLIFPKAKRIPDLATSGLASVALRMPSHPAIQELLELLDFPLAAPSANRFGKISPTRASDVEAEIGDRIEVILDGGPCEIGLESTIVRVESSGEVTVLRPGRVSREDLEAAHFRLSSSAPGKMPTGVALVSPGLLESHYAPEKSLTLLGAPIAKLSAFPASEVQNLGILAFSGNEFSLSAQIKKLTAKKFILKILSEKGDLREAAQNLFSHLRFLDEAKTDAIYSEPCLDETGIGLAIADRLKRAAFKKN